MSSLSIPLQVRGETLGALNLYSKTLSAFEGTGAANADLFGEHAAVAVANAYTFANALRLSENLKEALKSRELIGEAKGILMAREGVTEDEAFEMLRRASQRANLKLRDIAQELVNKIEARKPLGEPTDASSDE
jgi:GAF domain-containing protein